MMGLKDRFSFCLKLLPGLLGLGEVLSLMLAWSAVIRRGGATARALSYRVVHIPLVAQNQHQAATVQADLLGQWIARDFLECKKGFHGVDALCFWAFDLVDEFISIHCISPIHI
jgi:hypothetical protein